MIGDVFESLLDRDDGSSIDIIWDAAMHQSQEEVKAETIRLAAWRHRPVETPAIENELLILACSLTGPVTMLDPL